MQNLQKTTEEELIKFIDTEHVMMNFQPIIKIDKFGKKKIDRIIILTTHQIIIVYEGGLRLEVKTNIDISMLDYVILSTTSIEVMLVFNNQQKSQLHMVLE